MISSLPRAWWLGAALTCFLVAPALARPGVDNTLYAALLQKYVHHGVVDYAGFKRDVARLDAYLKILERVHPGRLSRRERMAFYINVYNAWTIRLILTKYPDLKSIKDLGSWFRSPWRKKIVRLAGGVYHLDHIEHDILRPRFKDPRVHFALNCASQSCPILTSRPYEAATLDRTLDENTRRFLADPQRNYLQGDTLYASRIFRWFRGDFKGGVVKFFIRYGPADLARKLEKLGDRVRVRYLSYDWSLNGR